MLDNPAMPSSVREVLSYQSSIYDQLFHAIMKRLSGAALETLAIIAYKQPVTKGEIEAIAKC